MNERVTSQGRSWPVWVFATIAGLVVGAFAHATPPDVPILGWNITIGESQHHLETGVWAVEAQKSIEEGCLISLNRSVVFEANETSMIGDRIGSRSGVVTRTRWWVPFVYPYCYTYPAFTRPPHHYERRAWRCMLISSFRQGFAESCTASIGISLKAKAEALKRAYPPLDPANAFGGGIGSISPHLEVFVACWPEANLATVKDRLQTETGWDNIMHNETFPTMFKYPILSCDLTAAYDVYNEEFGEEEPRCEFVQPLARNTDYVLALCVETWIKSPDDWPLPVANVYECWADVMKGGLQNGFAEFVDASLDI